MISPAASSSRMRWPSLRGPGVRSSNSTLKSCRSRPIVSASASIARRTERSRDGSSAIGVNINTMRQVIYSMGVSLDGFIAGPDGEIDWTAPDEELHRFHNEQTRELGGHLLGRRLYEEMAYWDTVDESSSLPEHELEFARIWKQLPKIVFSRTLESVGGNARLVKDNIAEEAARLKEAAGKDLAVGGAGLAAELVSLDLIDELRPFVYPAVVGGGTPYLPRMEERIGLRLVETRTFGSGVVYLRYQRTEPSAGGTA